MNSICFKNCQRPKNAAPGNADREQVKGLNDVALAHGKGSVRENSGRPLVRALIATSKPSPVAPARGMNLS